MDRAGFSGQEACAYQSRQAYMSTLAIDCSGSAVRHRGKIEGAESDPNWRGMRRELLPTESLSLLLHDYRSE